MAALIAVAETAQDVESALDQFLGPVADCSADITALIAQCFQTSSALRTLHDTLDDHLSPRRHQLISADVKTVRSSLNYTFTDVKRIFGGIQREGYRQVWRDLNDYFRAESGNTLNRRLQYYQQFLRGLTQALLEG